MKGLIIKAPWIDLILSGQKTWEIRGSNTKIRGKIALIQSGTGLIMGTAELVGSKRLSPEEYIQSYSYHCIPDTDRTPLPYKNIFAWILSNPTRLQHPIPYKHKRGAVIWVNVDDF
jgi:hypothetical protein